MMEHGFLFWFLVFTATFDLYVTLRIIFADGVPSSQKKQQFFLMLFLPIAGGVIVLNFLRALKNDKEIRR